jgi:hypothetical protein
VQISPTPLFTTAAAGGKTWQNTGKVPGCRGKEGLNPGKCFLSDRSRMLALQGTVKGTVTYRHAGEKGLMILVRRIRISSGKVRKLLDKKGMDGERKYVTQ